jgi:hypothetical protein
MDDIAQMSRSRSGEKINYLKPTEARSGFIGSCLATAPLPPPGHA